MEEGIQHAKTPPKVSWANEVQPERELSVKQISARFKGSSVPITEADFQRKLRAYRKIPSFATVQRNKIKNFKSPKKHLLMKEWSQIVESENVGVVDSESALDFLAHYDVTPNDMDAESWKEWLEAIESATTNINDGRRASLSLQADEANAVVQSVGGDSTNSENSRNAAIEINTNFSKDDTNQAMSNTGDSDSFSPLPIQLKPHRNNLTSDLDREEIALAPTPSGGGDGGDGEKSNATADNSKDSTSYSTHTSYDPQMDSIHMGETEDITNIVDHQQQRVEEQEEGDEEQEEVNYESIDATMVDYTSDFSENNTPSRTPAHTPPHSPKHAEDIAVASFESTYPQNNTGVMGSAPATVTEPSEQMSTSIGREDYVTDFSTEGSASSTPITGATINSAKNIESPHSADEIANPLLHEQHHQTVSDVSFRKEDRANSTTVDTDTSDDASVVTSILHQQPERQPADSHPLGTIAASGVASGEVESDSDADKSISTATTATTTNNRTTQQSASSTPAIVENTADSPTATATMPAAPEEEEEMPSKVRSKSFGVEMEKQNEQPAPGFFSCCFGSGRNKKKQKKAAARKEQLLRPMSRKSHIAGL